MARFLNGSLALGGLLLVYSLDTTLAWSVLLILGMVAARRLRTRAGSDSRSSA